MTIGLCDTEQAFLEDICTHPEDDGLRLIYADWLEEHDREQRARYIRVQIELAHLTEDAEYAKTSPAGRVRHLVQEQMELLTEDNFWEWFGPVLEIAWPKCPFLQVRLHHGQCAQVGYWSDPDGLRGWSLDLRRGFLDGIEWHRPDLRGNGKNVIRCQPVRTVRLRNAEPWENHFLVPSRWFWECCQCHEAEPAEGWNCLLGHHLPSKLFHCLRADGPEKGALPLRRYASKQSAEQDLSNACLRWCRQPAPRPAY